MAITKSIEFTAKNGFLQISGHSHFVFKLMKNHVTNTNNQYCHHRQFIVQNQGGERCLLC